VATGGTVWAQSGTAAAKSRRATEERMPEA
jgi:hypothetical protein